MKRSLLIVTIAFISLVTFAQSKQNPKLGKDPIDKIIKAMTLEEKAILLVGVDKNSTTPHMGVISGDIPGAGITAEFPEYGIPSTFMCDGPSGANIDSIRPGTDKKFYATAFPIEIMLASTWNNKLIEEVGRAMGSETKEYGCDVILAPAFNIMRNPLNGRNFEYVSEDPYLSGKVASAIVRGIQSQGVGTSIKHFVANNQQSFRMVNDAIIDQRTLREIYLKPFEIAVKESNPWTVMSSYNKVNGEWTQYSYPLLQQILREEWGYKGIVVTDWSDVRETAKQIHAGNDLLMGGKEQQTKDIIEAVKSGKLSMEDVDRNVKRLLTFIMKTSNFAKYPYSKNPDLERGAVVAKSAADEGIVMLKNDSNTLPLKSESKKVAMFGVGSYFMHPFGLGSATVRNKYSITMKQGLKEVGLEPLESLDTYYKKYMDWQTYSLLEQNAPTWKNWFFGFKKPVEADIDSIYITARAKEADVAIYTISRLFGEVADRHNEKGDYYLSDVEMNMLKKITEAFHKEGKKVIVVLNVGAAIETASWKNIPDAILMTWYPGQEGARPVADIITGKINPSGKLPITLENDYFDHPSSKNFPYDYRWVRYWDDYKDPESWKISRLGYTKYEEGIWVGYRHFNTFDKPVSYPFGFGLSYTTFEYSDLTVKSIKGGYSVSVKVTNSGKVAGKESVQLYISAPKSTKMDKPKRELKGYAKSTLLQPGESEVLTMNITTLDLASFDAEANGWLTEAGEYTISIGANVEDIRQSSPLTIRKEYKQPVKYRLQH